MVMRWFRHHQRTLLIVIVVAMVVAMVFFGALGTLLRLASRQREKSLFVIRGRVVRAAEWRAAERDLRLIERWLPGPIGRFIFEGESAQQERTRLITDRCIWRYLVLLREAELAGIQVTGPELGPLAGLGGDLRRAAVNMSKIVKLYLARLEAVSVTESELWMQYSHYSERFKLRFVELIPDLFISLIEPAEDEIRAFYEEHKDVEPDLWTGSPGYGAPARVEMEYVLAAAEDFAGQMGVADDEILQYYEQHKSEFIVSEEEDEPDAVEEEDSETEEAEPGADAAAEGEDDTEGVAGEPPQPNGGESEEAGEESEEPEEQGADEEDEPEGIGTEPTSAAGDATAETAEDSERTAEQGTEETEDEDEPQYKPLSAVKEQIRQVILARKAVEETLVDLANRASRFANEPLPLRQMANRHGLRYVAAQDRDGSPLLTRREVASLVPGGAEAARRIFEEAEDVSFRPVEADEGPLLFQVLGRRPPEPLPYEEVRDRVHADLVHTRALAMCEAEAGALMAEAKGSSLEQAVASANARLKEIAGAGTTPDAPPEPGQEGETEEEGEEENDQDDDVGPPLEIRQTDFFSRRDPVILGMRAGRAAVIREAFGLDQGQLATVTERGIFAASYVIQKIDEEPADPVLFHGGKSLLWAGMLLAKRQRLADGWMQGLLLASPLPEQEE